MHNIYENKIIPFLFEGDRLVRTVKIDELYWFVAKDICEILDIKNSRDAIEKLDDDEKGVALTDTLGGKQEVAVVSEGGLYTLILRSRLATTLGTIQHRFRKWVTNEVLPSIRRTGRYIPEQEISHPQITTSNPTQTSLRLVTEARLTWNPQAAREVWVSEGLVMTPAMFASQSQSDLFTYTAINKETAA